MKTVATAAALVAIAAGVPASAAAAPVGLPKTSEGVAAARPARRVPPLRVPVRPFQDAADDGDAHPPPANGLAQEPTPLTSRSRRHEAKAAEAPVVGGKLSGLGSNVIEPSDTQVGVGPTDVVEMVNSNVEYWSTNGASEGTSSLGSYFTDSQNDRRLDEMTDPRVIYDTQSGRWFASVLDLTRSQIVLVISSTARPGSGSWIYSFSSSGCQDQPRLGVSDALVAIGFDLFTDCGTYGRRVGGEVIVMSKSDLLTGAQVHDAVYGPSALYGAVTPVVSLSSTSILWFASSDFLFDSIDLFAADKVSASALGLRRVGINPIFEVPPALQSDPALISTGDNRVQNAVWENNQLLLTISNGCLVTGEDGVHACARYVGIDTTNTANPSVTMDATVALDQNRDMFYPTVMPASDGTIYSVFGYSSPGETPSIGVLTQPAQAAGWQELTTGTGANESGRWGDYFGIARDPTDPTHIWVAASYGTGGQGWATTVAALGSAAFQITPPPPDCIVPSVRGLRLGPATAKLYRAHCARGVVTLRHSPRSAGTVLSQDEPTGSDLANGTAVSLVESIGPKRKHH